MAKHDLINFWVSHDPDPGVHVLFRSGMCDYQKCTMCALWKEGIAKPNYQDVIGQIETFCGDQLTRVKEHLNEHKVKAITIGNNGSILNPATFAPSALFHCISRLWPVAPELKRLSLITEPQYITDQYLHMLMEQFIAWNQDNKAHVGVEEIEFTIGLETLEPAAIEYLNKRKDEATGLVYGQLHFEALAMRLHKIYQSYYQQEMLKGEKQRTLIPKFAIRHYVLLKPYPLEGQAAIDDVANSVKLGQRISKQYSVNVATHINPMYIAKKSEMCKQVEEGKISYTPPEQQLIARTILAVDPYYSDHNRYCLGLSDEGLSKKERQKNGQRYTFVPDDTSDPLWQKIEKFNENIADNQKRAFAIKQLQQALINAEHKECELA